MRRNHTSIHRWYCIEEVGAASFAVVVTLAAHLMIAIQLLAHLGHSPRPRSSANSPLVFAGLLAPEQEARGPRSNLRWVAATPPSATVFGDIAAPPEVEIPQEAPPPVGPVPDFIRRIGVITARIHGAWSLPGAPRSRDFHCRVRLREDEAGVLREVELWQCDDDPELRASLLKAIRASSPLPTFEANPEAARDLTLDFAAYASLSAGRRSSVEPSASMP